MNGCLLILDDEPNIRLTFRAALEAEGYVVHEAANAAEARPILVGGCDLLLLDLRIGQENGLDVLADLRGAGLRTPTVVITAHGSVGDAVRAMKLGAIDFLEKPVQPAALRAVVAEVLERHQPAAVVRLPTPAPAAVNATPPAPVSGFEGQLREAKRCINLQEFDLAARCLGVAMRLEDRSAEAHNLLGVLHEIRGDFDAARKSYGQAMKLDRTYEPARQNQTRLFELFNFGSSKRPFHLGPDETTRTTNFPATT